MLLAIDIGNSLINLGVFLREELQVNWHLATQVHKLPDEYAVVLLDLLDHQNLKPSQIDRAVICGVVPPLITTFRKLCHSYFGINPLVVEHGVRTGINIRMENPQEVGADRVSNAVAGHRLYGGPLIVIDFGTATTFDVISEKGDYLGGAIAPGIDIAAEALFERTAKLPRVELTYPQKVIGRSTVSAIQSGLLLGYIGLIEGMVARIRKELRRKAKVIATGGYAQLIAQQCQIIEVVDRNLSLIGLRIIHEVNCS